jgi:hypothetical protein
MMMQMRINITLLAVLFTCTLGMLLAGCTTTEPDETTVASAQLLPTIDQFSASPDNISSGETTKLSWSVSNATTISIDNGVGNVALNGERSVTPLTTTVYTLTASGPGGSNTATAQVMVASAGASSAADTPTLSHVPVINSFTASPAEITAGDSVTLTWNVSNASSVNINPTIGNVANTGSRAVNTAVTTSYLLTAINGENVVTMTALVEVNSDVIGVEHIGWLANVAYDFIERAPSAEWRNGYYTDRTVANSLTFPGTTNDNIGFACYRLNTKLNDGITYDKLLETHPYWSEDSSITGRYSDVYVPPGAKLKVKVGIISGATSGKVRFNVLIPDISHTAWYQPVAYADGVKTAEIDLSDFAGQTHTFELYVNTYGVSTQDWAAWAEAKIVN